MVSSVVCVAAATNVHCAWSHSRACSCSSSCSYRLSVASPRVLERQSRCHPAHGIGLDELYRRHLDLLVCLASQEDSQREKAVQQYQMGLHFRLENCMQSRSQYKPQMQLECKKMSPMWPTQPSIISLLHFHTAPLSTSALLEPVKRSVTGGAAPRCTSICSSRRYHRYHRISVLVHLDCRSLVVNRTSARSASNLVERRVRPLLQWALEAHYSLVCLLVWTRHPCHSAYCLSRLIDGERHTCGMCTCRPNQVAGQHTRDECCGSARSGSRCIGRSACGWLQRPRHPLRDLYLSCVPQDWRSDASEPKEPDDPQSCRCGVCGCPLSR